MPLKLVLGPNSGGEEFYVRLAYIRSTTIYQFDQVKMLHEIKLEVIKPNEIDKDYMLLQTSASPDQLLVDLDPLHMAALGKDLSRYIFNEEKCIYEVEPKDVIGREFRVIIGNREYTKDTDPKAYYRKVHCFLPKN